MLRSDLIGAWLIAVLASASAHGGDCLALVRTDSFEELRFFFTREKSIFYIHDALYDGVPVAMVRVRVDEWKQAGLIHTRAYAVSEMRRRQAWGDTGFIPKENYRVRELRRQAWGDTGFIPKENYRVRELRRQAVFTFYRHLRDERLKLTSGYFLAADLSKYFFVTETGYAVFSAEGGILRRIRVIWPDAPESVGPILQYQLRKYLSHFHDQDPRE